MSDPTPADQRAATTEILILRELYEIKMLLIEAVGREKYKSIDLDKVVQYIDKSAGSIAEAKG